MVVAGACALWLSDRMPWRWVFLLLGLAMVPGALAALRAPEPAAVERPRTLREAVVEPFREFLGRRAALPMAASILLFKTGDNLATLLFNPFLLELGYPASEIGLASAYAGLGALFAGGMAGGWLVHRFPLPRCLRPLAWLQAAAILAALPLVALEPGRTLLLAVTGLQNFIFSMGSVAFLSQIAALCHPSHAATQFALLTGLSSLTRVLFPSLTGFLARGLGWPAFLMVSALLSLPVLGALRGMEAWDWPRPPEA
jgi:PAT family beta-lactamase induction signal transducer AmpG